MATIRDISKRCGVSVATVSKVLNGYREIGEETKQKVLKAAEELGYVQGERTKYGRQRRGYQIGFLLSTLSSQGLKNEYFASILSAFRQEATRAGYDITFIEHNVGKKSLSYLEHCRSRGFDGVCIACADFSRQEVLELINSEFPVVTIDQSFNESISILSDNADGMRQLTEYIISRGHTRIACIHGTHSVVTHNRLVSFHSVMARYGLAVPEEYLLEGEYQNADAAERLAGQLLDGRNPPTCILAPDDYAALGLIKAIKRRGLRIPEDISVAGYDGISVSQALEPKLTTVRQDTERIGREAARQLICLMESPMTTPLETIVMPVELVEGESVGRLGAFRQEDRNHTCIKE